mgnify:CR=1 FL=1
MAKSSRSAITDFTRRTKKLNASTAGMATAMPMPVAISASPIGPATTSMDALPMRLMSFMADMIPTPCRTGRRTAPVLPTLASTGEPASERAALAQHLLLQVSFQQLVPVPGVFVTAAIGRRRMTQHAEAHRGQARERAAVVGNLRGRLQTGRGAERAQRSGDCRRPTRMNCVALARISTQVATENAASSQRVAATAMDEE